MNMDACIEVALMLGSQYSVSGDDVMLSCPNAPFTTLHKTAQDRHFSFGMKVTAYPHESVVHCFTCGLSGTASYIFWLLSKQHRIDKSVAQFIRQQERVDAYALKNFLHHRQVSQPLPMVPCTPLVPTFKSFLNNRNGDAYLCQRGIMPQEIAVYKLGFDDSKQRVIFPICTRSEIVGAVGRSINGQEPKYYKYPVSNEAVLFGEHLLDCFEQNLILVEGPFDAIKVRRVHPNVMALNGLHLSPTQLERVLHFADTVTLLLDGDGAGRNAVDKLGSVLSARTRTYVAMLPDNTDPDTVSTDVLRETLFKRSIF